MSDKFNIKSVASAPPQHQWETLGPVDSTAGGADATLAVTERDYATAAALDNSVVYEAPAGATKLNVRSYFSTNDADAVFDIWAMREGDTQMTRVCTITAKGGQQTITVSATTYQLSDTQTVSNNVWYDTPATITAANTIASTYFGTFGYSTFLFHANTTVDEDFYIQVSAY